MSNNTQEQQLKRGLKNRQIQLMAIGGAIGTGLFMGSGQAINTAGPSIVLIYAVTGLILFFVMRAMGEILLSNLEYRSFLDFTNILLGPWMGFLIGWTYWLCWIVTGTADIIAICKYSAFWWPNIHTLIPATIAISCLILLNLAEVKFFGEIEFWLSLIKLITIIFILFIVSYLVLKYNNVNGISILNLWNHGNLLPNGTNGFFKGFQIAVFSFVGIELAGTAAAEVQDPLKTMPKAINSIPVRIIFCYIFSLIAIITITPWDKVATDQSPFISIFLSVGLPMTAGIINLIVLLSALSSANSGVFSTSRMLFGLAKLNKAPFFLAKLAKHKVPVNALVVSTICLFLTYLSIHYIPRVMNAFTIITSVSAILFIFVWSVIVISYIAYRKKHPSLHATSNYKLPGGTYTCYTILIFFAFILYLLSLDQRTRIALLVAPIWLSLLNIAYIFGKKRLFKI